MPIFGSILPHIRQIGFRGKLLKINEMANDYAVKHSRLPSHFGWISVTISLPSAYPMLAEEGVEVGAVDVDFAADLGEGDEALVAVVLPRLGEMPRISRTSSDSNHSLLESSALHRVMKSMICSSVSWRLRHSSSSTLIIVIDDTGCWVVALGGNLIVSHCVSFLMCLWARWKNSE